MLPLPPYYLTMLTLTLTLPCSPYRRIKDLPLCMSLNGMREWEPAHSRVEQTHNG